MSENGKDIDHLRAACAFLSLLVLSVIIIGAFVLLALDMFFVRIGIVCLISSALLHYKWGENEQS